MGSPGLPTTRRLPGPKPGAVTPRPGGPGPRVLSRAGPTDFATWRRSNQICALLTLTVTTISPSTGATCRGRAIGSWSTLAVDGTSGGGATGGAGVGAGSPFWVGLATFLS